MLAKTKRKFDESQFRLIGCSAMADDIAHLKLVNAVT